MMAITSKRILIVEDSVILSLVAERLLRKMGHEVVEKATSGEKAVELFKKLKPDLILMDISLNGEMDGFEATTQIRKHAEVPIIFLSGNSSQYEKTEKKEGYNEFISKPITYNNLDKAISNIWDDEQSRDTPSADSKLTH